MASDPVSRAFARSLLRLRTGKRMTYRALGDSAGISAGFICEMEAGRKGCTLRVAHAIAEALDTTIDAMIGEDDLKAAAGG